MLNSQPEAQNHKHYSKILYEKRLQLIRLVEEEDFPISQAAQALQIKLSTAKLIVSRYRQTGKIFKRKSQRLQSHRSETNTKNNAQIVSPSVQTSNPPAPTQIAIKNGPNEQNLLPYGDHGQAMIYYWQIQPYQHIWSLSPFFF